MKTQYIIRNKEGTFYYKNRAMNIFHREDGPAFEQADGSKEWWLNGREVTEAEHKRRTKKEPTITIEGISFTVDQLKELINQVK